jgi:16S rRNA (guanine966-N2)-methyltransferase
MRIISGKLKGRKINPPSNLPVRPTTDQAKEALFNILNNEFDYSEIRALDLFSGTGSIGYELCSRGCPEVHAVEMNWKCTHFIQQVKQDFNLSSLYIHKANVFTWLTTHFQPFDVIFADPPYDMEHQDKIVDIIRENKLLKEGGIFIIEHDKRSNFSEMTMFFDQRNYGKVNFSFFRNEGVVE